MIAKAGYQEIEHTADIALRIWAPSIPELLVQAAKGMFALCGIQGKKSSRRQRIFQINFSDHENLLVNFLSEVLYYVERDKLVLDRFQFTLHDHQMTVIASGYPILSIQKMIKAVTYHKLEIKTTENGFAAQIVFDV